MYKVLSDINCNFNVNNKDFKKKNPVFFYYLIPLYIFKLPQRNAQWTLTKLFISFSFRRKGIGCAVLGDLK